MISISNYTKIVGTIALVGSMVGPASAHEGKEQLLGPIFWKSVFFGAILFFLIVLFSTLVQTCKFPKRIEKILLGVVILAGLVVAGRYSYHYLIH